MMMTGPRGCNWRGEVGGWSEAGRRAVPRCVPSKHETSLKQEADPKDPGRTLKQPVLLPPFGKFF